MAFHPGGDLLVTGSGDGTSRLWDARTGRPLVNWPAGIGDMHFSRDGTVCGFAVLGRTGAADGGGGRPGVPYARQQPGRRPRRVSRGRHRRGRAARRRDGRRDPPVGPGDRPGGRLSARSADGLGQLRRPPGWPRAADLRLRRPAPLADPRGPRGAGAAAHRAPPGRRPAHRPRHAPTSARTVGPSPWPASARGRRWSWICPPRPCGAPWRHTPA